MLNDMDYIHNQLWNDDWFQSRWIFNNNSRINSDTQDNKQIEQQNKANDNIKLDKPKEETKSVENQLAKTDSNNKGLLSSLWKGWDVNKSISLNVSEEGDKYIMNATIPEFNKDQLKLQIKDGLLTISGELKEEHKDEHSHRKSSKFVQRSITLPENINEGNISAKYENGVLSVNMPKLDKSKDTRGNIMIE